MVQRVPKGTGRRPAAAGERGAERGRRSRAVEPYPVGLVERALGKAPGSWRGRDLVRLARDHGIRLLSLIHVGGDGCLRRLDFVPRSEAHFLDILEGGERADGSSLFRGLGIQAGASDILLRPRPATAFLDPFATLPTLAVLCGHADRDGRPLAVSPDAILAAAAERLRAETGSELLAHGEIEYFLGRQARDGDACGRSEDGYHAASPFVFGEMLRQQALTVLSAMGVAVKYGHSEVGWVGASEAGGTVWEQHEIELHLSPLGQAAEGIVLTQWVLRNLAREGGFRLSLDPILREGHAGNGLHVHFAPRAGGPGRGPGRPAAAREREAGAGAAAQRLDEPSRWLIGGLIRLGAALMAFGNRTPDSFVRLRQAREAPDRICWGEFDRRALVRLPVVARAADGRPVSEPTVEFRLPDGSAHPQLLLAGVAQAMVEASTAGDLAELLASTAVEGAAGSARPVPRDRAEVAQALRDGRRALEAGRVFPPSLLDRVLEDLAT